MTPDDLDEIQDIRTDTPCCATMQRQIGRGFIRLSEHGHLHIATENELQTSWLRYCPFCGQALVKGLKLRHEGGP
jgi:hypothetical protein